MSRPYAAYRDHDRPGRASRGRHSRDRAGVEQAASPWLRIGEDIRAPSSVPFYDQHKHVVDSILLAAGNPSTLTLMQGFDDGPGSRTTTRYMCIHRNDPAIARLRHVDVASVGTWSPSIVSPVVLSRAHLHKLYQRKGKKPQLIHTPVGATEDQYECLRLLWHLADPAGRLRQWFDPHPFPRIRLIVAKSIYWDQSPRSASSTGLLLGVELSEGSWARSEPTNTIFFYNPRHATLRNKNDRLQDRRSFDSASQYLNQDDGSVLTFLVVMSAEATDILQHLSLPRDPYPLTHAVGEISDSLRSLSNGTFATVPAGSSQRSRSRSPSRTYPVKSEATPGTPNIAAAAWSWTQRLQPPLIMVHIDFLWRVSQNIADQTVHYEHVAGGTKEDVGRSKALYHAFCKMVSGPAAFQCWNGLVTDTSDQSKVTLPTDQAASAAVGTIPDPPNVQPIIAATVQTGSAGAAASTPKANAHLDDSSDDEPVQLSAATSRPQSTTTSHVQPTLSGSQDNDDLYDLPLSTTRSADRTRNIRTFRGD